MSDEKDSLQAAFDAWSSSYDADVRDDGLFPFAGYDRVLSRVLELAALQPAHDVLELGTGTGKLTARLLDTGAAVYGLDFSEGMLTLAREKASGATLVQGHALEPLPPPLGRRYDRVVGTYVMHEFPLADKLALVSRLMEQHLASGGRLVFGDIGFPDASSRQREKEHAGERWDDEFYWLEDETRDAFGRIDLTVRFEQVSSCGIVVELVPTSDSNDPTT